ncbi:MULTISPECIES: hypothetical protein [Deinococcus]|uniref:Lipoprotein n=1 Tax=Deinococcus rufus TaxID=2136097 RepID=A0ABV7Z623_9DEIO|nr:hypothetical protein [Deinococcus sp. AB2017081]WQE95784.1 hypothetical protein U2P90_02560 [Deinococcus sp. AB2017081]
MNRIVLSVLFAALAASCARLPVANAVTVNFDRPEASATALNTSPYRRYTVYVQTDQLTPEVAASASRATLTTRSRSLQGFFFPVAPDNTYFQFNAGDRCSPDLIGENVTLAYQVFSASGEVIASRAVVLPQVIPCTG